jgi:hypothetical protein
MGDHHAALRAPLLHEVVRHAAPRLAGTLWKVKSSAMAAPAVGTEANGRHGEAYGTRPRRSFGARPPDERALVGPGWYTR